MPSLPAPTQTDRVIQNQTTGVVDYLKYEGRTLVASSSHDYGLGSDFKIVASGNFGAGNELVAQSKSTGQLDFLQIDPTTGNLLASFLTSIPGGLPSIHAAGVFDDGATSGFTGQVGPTLVAQLADGSLDFLGFDASHNFIGSDLLAGTAGLPTLRGAGEAYANYPLFASFNQTNDNDSLITQLADGTLDAIGFTGNLSDGSLAYTNSLLLAETAGSAPVTAVNQNSQFRENIPSDPNAANPNEGVQIFTDSSSALGALYIDSGYGAGATEGALYAANSFAPYGGWTTVDGSYIVDQIFPVA